MCTALRIPESTDYLAIATWIPDVQSCVRWAGPRVPFPFSAAELPSLLAVDGGASYCLAEEAAGPLGFGQHWELLAGAVHLGRIIVSPAARGQGLGRRLCQLLVAQAVHATGATAVTLRVYRNNTAAFSLYSSLGFIPVEPASTEDVLFMRAEVHPSMEQPHHGAAPGCAPSAAVPPWGAASLRR